MNRLWVAALVVGCGSSYSGPSFEEDSCDVPADCTGDAKFCVDGKCVLTCASDNECLPFGDHRYCVDGACVVCEDDTECVNATASVCDASTHACRGCQADSECSGGVCIEATGTCVADQDVAFVATGGGSTACTRDLPCGTFNAAKTALAGRRVIHVLGARFADPNIIVGGIDQPLVIDGESTVLGDGVAGALVIVPPGDITIEGFSFVVPPAASMEAGLTVSGAVTVKVFDIEIPTLAGKAMVVNGTATVTMTSSHIGTSKTSAPMTIECADATLVVDRNQFDSITLADGNSCNLTATHNRFDSFAAMDLSGSVVDVENNVFTGLGTKLINSVGSSVVRFNTFYVLDAFVGTGLTCDDSIVVTSNIFITGETPVVGCTPRYSVFGLPAAIPDGVGNKGAVSGLIVDSSLHLLDDSVAKGAAEPGQVVMDDFDGSPRPNPPGSVSDSGALEAP